VAFGSPKFN